jgi:hypothetical protein
MADDTHRRVAAIGGRRLVLLGVSFCFLLPLVSLAQVQRKTNTGQSKAVAVPVPSPTPQPSPPTIEFEAVTARERTQPGEEIPISLFVSNKSPIAVTDLKLNFAHNSFVIAEQPLLPGSLAPFDSVTATTAIKSKDDARYETHKLLLTLEYNWKSNGTEFTSAQPATATVVVQRRFEEETKGFPGGTAAFFYLLLPIIPAILSYQFVDGLRKGEGPKLPSFSAEYIVPAFFAAVVLSLAMLFAFKLNAGLNYSNPLVFTSVLFGSFAIGCVVPLFRWRHENNLKKLWGFTNTETLETYLRKALLAPWSPREFTWATGKVDRDEWSGIVLKQPNGVTVLGAVLQVSTVKRVSDDEWNLFLKDVISADGLVKDRLRLVQMVEAKELQLDFDTRITHAGNNIGEVVVIEEVKNWKRAGGKASPLINPYR